MVMLVRSCLLIRTTTRQTSVFIPKLPTTMSCGRFLSTQAPTVTLYQYTICPFCCKTKAFLGYVSQKYTTVEVNPLTKKELKQLSQTNKNNNNNEKEYKKVPIAQINQEIVKGSDDIIRALLNEPSIQTTLQDHRWASSTSNMTLDQFVNTSSSNKWSQYATNELAPILYTNICTSLWQSYQAFQYVHSNPKFSFLQKHMISTLGSVAMFAAASKIKKKRGITNEREALETCLKTFETDGLLIHNPNTTFSSGLDVPDLGDIVMYGVLRSVEKSLSTSNQGELFREGSALKVWYDTMQKETSY